jgi:hypothetical protein
MELCEAACYIELLRATGFRDIETDDLWKIKTVEMTEANSVFVNMEKVES